MLRLSREAWQPMNEVPVVRHFLACNDIQASGGNVTLTNVIHTIRPRPGDQFPCLQPLLCLYALLTNGRGEHEFEVSLVRATGPEETEVYRTPKFRRDLGQDPMAVH